jgi:hypothetical protein
MSETIPPTPSVEKKRFEFKEWYEIAEKARRGLPKLRKVFFASALLCRRFRIELHP